jgi:membrane associated rhomboid family serine protease
MQKPPPVIWNLLILNGLVFLLLNLVVQTKFPESLDYFLLHKSNLLGLHSHQYQPMSDGSVEPFIDMFRPTQIVLHFFSHIGFLHFLFNMLALYSIGTPVEMVMGSRRFLQYYLTCGVLGGMLIAFLDPSPNPVLGASGAVSGVLVAFALYFPQNQLFILPFPFPIRAWKLVVGFAVISLVLMLIGSGGGVSHFGHLAGMAVAAGYFYIGQLRRK